MVHLRRADGAAAFLPPMHVLATKIEQGVSFPVFHASIEGNENTKLYAGEDLNIYWNAQDAISLFNKSDANSKATFTGADGASSGDFQVTSAGSGSTALDYVYAVYPYNEAYAVSSSGISAKTPSKRSSYPKALPT